MEASVGNGRMVEDGVVLFADSLGLENHARLHRVTRHLAVIELLNPATVLQVSEVLREFRIILRDRTAYSGRATVKNLLHTGLTTLCEATLEDAWVDLDHAAAACEASHVREEFDSFMREWHKCYRILPEYKIIVADMQTFLTDLRRWLDELELGLRALPSSNRLQVEQDVLQAVGEPVVPAINGLFERFERVAGKLEDDQLPSHHAYMKRYLHPLMLASPFASRTFHKPLGYAGDYEMVNMMTRNPYEGSTAFAKIVNLWFLRQPPAEAHRNRLVHLEEKLVAETARVAARGRPARIYSLGCGPAVEIQRFLAHKGYSERASFVLADFNEETLRHAQMVLEHAAAQNGRNLSAQYVRKSVQQILKEAGRSIERPVEQCYDLVYCAGLFDYLSDAVCRRVLGVLYNWLAPGGLFLTTNVAPVNPLRNGMEHLLDWHLIYRNARQLSELRPPQAPAAEATVRSDVTGVNLFLEVRKPGHAQ